MRNKIQEIKDRAMFLGLDNEYLDKERMLFIKNGLLFLNMEKYVESTANLDIIVPEGIDIIYMDITDRVYADREEYNFIFPSTLRYIGGVGQEIMDGVIDLGSITYMYKNFHSFELSTFDFRRCQKLKRYDSGFANISIKKILFSDSIITVGKSGFSKAKIVELSIPKLKVVHNEAFFSAEIDKLNLGTQIERIKESSLCFASKQEELIVGDLLELRSRVFQNIKNIYVPYDCFRDLEELKGQLTGIIELIDTKEECIEALLARLNVIKVEFQKNDWRFTEPLHSIEKCIHQYLLDSGNSYLFDKIYTYASKLIATLQDYSSTIYLYKSGSGLDVHNRNYQIVGRSEKHKVYVEF